MLKARIYVNISHKFIEIVNSMITLSDDYCVNTRDELNKILKLGILHCHRLKLVWLNFTEVIDATEHEASLYYNTCYNSNSS